MNLRTSMEGSGTASLPVARVARIAAPEAVIRVVSRLRAAGHEAWVVGGAVRDSLLGDASAPVAAVRRAHGHGEEPAPNWDVATAATPGEVQALFVRTVPIGVEHGTVAVHEEGLVIEVTTFRADVETFGRHARVRFSRSLAEDLERRDFTINALAWDPETGAVVDPFGGLEDLHARVLRAVGDPRARFAEDYLRILRAARFAARFDLEVLPDVRSAMAERAAGTAQLSGERVRDELLRTLEGAERPSAAFRLLRDTGVLAHVLPELDACFGVEQNRWHADDVATHTLLVVDAVARKRRDIRVLALLHDLGKPAAKTWDEARGDWVFRGHDEIGAGLARGVLERLRFPRREIERLEHLVRVHMDLFPIEAGDAAVRRWIQRVGAEHVRALFALHFADWRGNRAKPWPARELRALYRRARRVMREARALRIADLAVGGDDLIALGLQPGPRFREILEELLREVVETPALNDRDRLLVRARELAAAGAG
jgi:tRNA nucleotidyltransferase (CCA-adding enzyme)